MHRRQVLEEIAALVAQRATGLRPLLVGIDGVDGAGKTVFADELADTVQSELAVVRASVDGFHQPAGVRHQRGRRSPEGFFYDSYDYSSLRRLLLDPLRGDLQDDGPREIVRAAYDVEREQPVEGQRLYLTRCRPREHATVVIDNEHLDAPRILQ